MLLSQYLILALCTLVAPFTVIAIALFVEFCHKPANNVGV